MISKEQVKDIADLSRLTLSEEEIVKMQRDLSSILDYFNILKKAKASSKNPLVKGKVVLDSTKNSLRKDEAMVKNANVANDIIKAAPAHEGGYIKVKTIF